MLGQKEALAVTPSSVEPRGNSEQQSGWIDDAGNLFFNADIMEHSNSVNYFGVLFTCKTQVESVQH